MGVLKVCGFGQLHRILQESGGQYADQMTNLLMFPVVTV